MMTLSALGITAAAVVVAAAVSVLTVRILNRRLLVAKQINEAAGVRDVRIRDEARPYESFREVLSSTPPGARLDMLAVSGWTVLQPDILQTLIRARVAIRALLLDPVSGESLLAEEPWLADETRRTLAHLQAIGDSTYLQVRLYQGLQTQTLLFLDEHRVFVSSFFPITSHPRLVFEIAPGERSLYGLYRDAFEYIWTHSKVFGRPDAERGGRAALR
jgi:hypothetical protein